MSVRHYCLMALLCLPALLPLAPARAGDDESPNLLLSPNGPVLEWRARRSFKPAYRPAWICLSSDGKLLAACAVGGKEPGHIWDPRTGEEVARFGEGSRQFYGARFSADGRKFAYVDSEIDIRIFDVEQHGVVRELKPRLPRPGNSHIIDGYPAFPPDGKLIASGVSEEGLKLWDVATGKDLNRFPTFRTKSLTGESFPHGPKLVTGRRPSRARMNAPVTALIVCPH
jgi:WD40 repeat protein